MNRLRFFILLLPSLFLLNGLSAQVAPEASLPEEQANQAEGEARISFFDVILKNQSVEIRWQTVPAGANVVLYRSTRPFENMTALAYATIVAANEEALPPYIDYPVPGVPYYYAVIPESVIRSGNVIFRYGENTSEMPVEVPGEYVSLPSETEASARSIPLPRLNLAGATQASPAAFSEETERIISLMNAAAEKQNVRQEQGRQERDIPYRFPEDTTGGSGGEEAALKSILDSNFSSENWEGLQAELSRFLSLRRAENVAARARFYLGEAHYFLGNYRRAIEEFLLMRDAYPAKAGEWIQKALKRL